MTSGQQAAERDAERARRSKVGDRYHEVVVHLAESTDLRCPVCGRAADVTRGASLDASAWCHLDAGGFEGDMAPHITCDLHGLRLRPEGQCDGCDDVRFSTTEGEQGMSTEHVITTKVEKYLGHRVYVDGVEVGVITRYQNGSWYALYPERYPLGAARKDEAAAQLVADLEQKEGEQA